MTARPDVPGPMPYMLDGGNWEGGCTDTQGRRWRHVPNVGWELRPGPQHPFLVKGSSKPTHKLPAPPPFALPWDNAVPHWAAIGQRGHRLRRWWQRLWRWR